MKMINDWTRWCNWLKRTRKQTKLANVHCCNVETWHSLGLESVIFSLVSCIGHVYHWIIYRFALVMTWHSHMRHYETETYFNLRHFNGSSSLFLSHFLKLDTITMKKWPVSSCDALFTSICLFGSFIFRSDKWFHKKWLWMWYETKTKWMNEWMPCIGQGKVLEITVINKK